MTWKFPTLCCLRGRVRKMPSRCWVEKGPKEWQHQVLAVEESRLITVDYAIIRKSLEDDLLSVKEAKGRSDWGKWKEGMNAKISQLTK